MRSLASAAARPLGLALAALLAVAGLLVSVTPATADTARLADPMTGAPAAGDCYDVTYKQGWEHAISEDTVPCSRKHTMRVVQVAQLPASVDMTDADAVSAAGWKACQTSYRRYFGKDPARNYLTLLTFWFFAPTKAQIDAGARWTSCEVALASGEKLLPLAKGSVPKATAKKPADSIARCVNRKNDFVPCSAAHVLRATYAFQATTKGSDKAKAKAVAKAAGRTCGRQVKNWQGIYSGKPVSKTKAVIACYVKTTR
jgi:hypothetical protein